MSRQTKSSIVLAAERSQVSVAALMRDLAFQVTAGRSFDGAVRADMATVRSVANVILALTDDAKVDPGVSDKLAEAGKRLRQVAGKHLGPSP